MSRDKLVTKLAVKYGLLICACYVLYFLLLIKLGLISMDITRVVYPIIFLPMTTVACIEYKYLKRENSSLNLYFIYVLTIVSILPFMMFIYLYWSLSDPRILRELAKTSWELNMLIDPSDPDLTEQAIPFVILFEGVLFEIISSYFVLRLVFRKEKTQ